MENRRFFGLDGLRGLCALSVVLYHSAFLFRAGVIFCHAYLAVDMFFMLSGFVISASYDARFARGLGAFAFLKMRLRRLAPVYWAGLALCVAAALVCASPSLSPGRTLLLGAMAAGLVPVFGAMTFAYPANSVAWSLAWEILVNIAYAKGLRRLTTPWMLALIAVLLAGATAESFVNPRGWSFGMTGADLWWAGTRAVPEFLMGVLLRRAHTAGWLDRLPRVTPALPFLAWLAIAVLPQGLSPVVDLAIVVVACPLLIALLVRGEAGAPRWFVPLGAVSYPLYASHLALIELAKHTPFLGLNHGPRPVLAALVVVLAVGLAWGIHRLCDPRPRPKAPEVDVFAGFPPELRAPGACETAPKSV